jgi:hypothetical protein
MGRCQDEELNSSSNILKELESKKKSPLWDHWTARTHRQWAPNVRKNDYSFNINTRLPSRSPRRHRPSRLIAMGVVRFTLPVAEKNRRSAINAFIGFLGNLSELPFLFRIKFKKNYHFVHKTT